MRFRPSRCHLCGLLGRYATPSSSTSLSDLQEVLARDRQRWEGERRRAVREGRDPTTLDLDKGASFGVTCSVGDSRGTGTSWALLGKESLKYGHNPPGAIVFDPNHPNDFRHVLGFAQNFVSNHVRAHDCPHFIKHRLGLTPLEHVRWREGQSSVVRRVRDGIGLLRDLWWLGLALAAVVVFLAAIVQAF